MGTRDPALIAERFKTAMALFEVAEAMLRQKLRRKYPLATEAAVVNPHRALHTSASISNV